MKSRLKSGLVNGLLLYVVPGSWNGSVQNVTVSVKFFNKAIGFIARLCIASLNNVGGDLFSFKEK
ncbi:hypothetical protein ZMO02_09500 [Zymomonas mobilis subsp. pomaceae]|nr:hypothetical protein ZMO02_09500 [Zymomonas mobilis subsp. pomaceae]